MPDGRLAGRVAVVTGASRGIGAAIAQRFALAGAHVAAVARTLEPSERMPGNLRETVAQITAAGGKAFAVQADLAQAADRERLVDEVRERAGEIDVLVNNAAATWLAPASTFDPKKYDLMFALQVQAPFELVRLVVPGMTEQGRGWVLNVSSQAARKPSGPPFGDLDMLGTSVYGMCKAALERLTSGLAAEVYPHGIAVNTLAPARIVATWGTLHHNLVPADSPDEIEYPEEFAEAALALCSGDPAVDTNLRLTTDEALARFALTPTALDGSSFVRPSVRS